MKINNYYFAVLAMATIVCLGSCARNKTAKSTTTKSAQVRKDTINVPKEKVVDIKTVDIKTKTTTKETVVTETTVVVEDNPQKTLMPLPPQSVAAIFKKEYPYAAAIIWDDILPNGKNGKLYLANFFLGDNKNSAIYNEKGIEVEKRSTILPDQLPQNVYDAIKNKYSDAQILSATTLRSTRTKGEYTAVVKSEAFATESEFILTDKGMFVEK